MDEQNLTPTVDTSLWQMPATVATPVDINKSSLPAYTEVPALPNIKDISPDISALVGSIRFDAVNTLTNMGKGEGALLDKLFPDRKKLDLTTEVPLTETHQLMSDGETWMPKYSSYMPGVDNDARLSAQQTDWQKFMNPIKRFVSNTSKAPLDLLSGVYGIGAAALTGRFDAIYNNDFAHYVDDLTERTNLEYKNYYNQKERSQDLGLNIQTWDKVLGGAEFTARMLASEAIIAAVTDGASLPSSFAKLGLRAGLAAERANEGNRVLQVGRDIGKMMGIATAPELATATRAAENVANSGSRMLGALETAANRGRLADNLVKARFAITSPMYEAGFEARHFQKEAESQFWDYYNQRGIQPTPEEINNFSNKLSGASNGVFFANMAILAPSNLAMVGDILNIKNPLAKWVTSGSEGITRNLFRIGTEVGKDGTYQAMKAGFWNKAAAYVTPFAKGALVEGVWEEGSQGIASNTYKNYVASSYDPEAMKSTTNYIDSFAKAFSDQFSTKEGMEEVIIGALIGGLMGGVGGARATSREYKNQANIATIQNAGTEFADNLRSNIYTNEQLLSLFSSAGRFQNLRQQLETANAQGDKFKEASLQAQSFISLLDAYNSVGKGNEFTNMIKGVFQGLDNQYVADTTGLNVNEVDAFKQEQIQDMNDMADKYSTALEAGRYLFGNKVGGFSEVELGDRKVKVSGQNLANALAFSSTMALFNEKYAAETFNAFQNKLAQMNVGNDLIEKMGAIAAIKKASAVELESYYQLNAQEARLKGEVNRITDKLNTLEAGEDKTAAAIQRVEEANKLIQIQNQLAEVSGNKDTLWKSMVDNFYSKMNKTGYAPQIDLDTFTKQVKDIQSSIENTNYSAEDKLVLNQLLDQFDEANSQYKSFAKMANDISDNKFSFRTYNHMFSGMRAKMDKSINDHTRDTLLQLYGQGQIANAISAQTFEANQRSASPITEEVLNSEEAPTENLISYMKERLKSVLKLTANEKTFYDRFKQQIDEYEEDPLNSTSPATEISDSIIKLNAKQAELDNLEEGIYSEDLQEEINNIGIESNLNSRIEEVKNKLGHEGNKAKFDNLIRLLNFAKDNMSQEQIETLLSNITDESVAVVGGTTDVTRNNVERGDLDTAWIIDQLNFNGLDFVEFETALAQLFSYIQSDNNTDQQPETALEIVPDALNTPGSGAHSNPIFIGDIVREILSGTDSSVENETEIKNRIEKERIKLEDELAVLQGEVTDAERRQRLQEEIQDVRNEIIAEIQDQATEADYQYLLNNSQVTIDENYGKSEEEIKKMIKNPAVLNNAKIQRLLELQRELSEMDNQKVPFDPSASPVDQLEWIIKNIPGLNFETVDDLAGISRPTQDVVDEYIDLLNTRGRNTAQKKRLAELREDLMPFNLAEGLPIDGINVLDIINLYNQYKGVQDVNNNQTSALNEEDLQEIVNSVDKVNQNSEFRSAKVGLVYDGAYIERKENGYKIYHVKLNTMLDQALAKGFNPLIEVYGRDSDGNRVITETFAVTEDNAQELGDRFDGERNIKVDLSPENYLIKYENDTSFYVNGDMNEMLDLLDTNSYAITGQPTNYISLYDANLDGSFSPRISEFQVTNNGVEIPFEKEILNSIKSGDTVTLEFDLNDDYNKTLTEDQYATDGRIYVKKNGKLVNILKGTNVKKSATDGWSELEAVRKKVVEAAKTNKTVTVGIEGSYLGFPIINLNEDGTAKEVAIDESKVLAYGYIDENGVLKGAAANVTIDNDQYVSAMSGLGKRTPIMVFKAYGQNIAFPINLKPTGTDLSGEVDNIINNDELSRERKIFEINALLASNNLFTEDLAMTTQDFDTARVKEALSDVFAPIDITNQTALNNAEKTAFIDVNDSFKSSKLRFDFGNVVEEQIQDVGKAVQETARKTVKTPGRKGRKKSDDNQC